MDKTAVVLMTVLAILVIGLYPYLGIVSKPVVITLTTTSTTTVSRTLTNTVIVTETVTTTAIRNISITTYSEDPEIKIYAKPMLDLLIYVTNAGNTTKHNLKMFVITHYILGGYKLDVRYIEFIEPNTSLRFEIDLSEPIDRFWIYIVH